MLKASFPNTTIRVRLDGGFANPEFLDYLEGEEVGEIHLRPGRALQFAPSLCPKPGANRRFWPRLRPFMN